MERSGVRDLLKAMTDEELEIGRIPRPSKSFPLPR